MNGEKMVSLSIKKSQFGNESSSLIIVSSEEEAKVSLGGIFKWSLSEIVSLSRNFAWLSTKHVHDSVSDAVPRALSAVYLERFWAKTGQVSGKQSYLWKWSPKNQVIFYAVELVLDWALLKKPHNHFIREALPGHDEVHRALPIDFPFNEGIHELWTRWHWAAKLRQSVPAPRPSKLLVSWSWRHTERAVTP